MTLHARKFARSICQRAFAKSICVIDVAQTWYCGQPQGSDGRCVMAHLQSGWMQWHASSQPNAALVCELAGASGWLVRPSCCGQSACGRGACCGAKPACAFRAPAFASLRVCFYGALFVDEKQFGNLRVRVCTRVFTPLIFIMWTRESTCALGFRPFRSRLFVRVRVTAAHARQRLSAKPEPPCVMHVLVACCAWRQARVFRVLSCARLLLAATDPQLWDWSCISACSCACVRLVADERVRLTCCRSPTDPHACARLVVCT